jgi:hypothetical protein
MTQPFRFSHERPFEGLDQTANGVPPVRARDVMPPEWRAFFEAEFRSAPFRSANVSVSFLETAWQQPNFVTPDGGVDYTKRGLQIDQIAQNWLHGQMPREIRVVRTGRSEGYGGSPYQKIW